MDGSINKKRVVVTGGAGFIGSHVVERLAERGYFITVIDNLVTGFDNVGLLQEKGVDLQVQDISNYGNIERCFVGADSVIHLAAMNRAQRSIDNPLAANSANTTGTINVLEASRVNGVPRVINISSSSVYGFSEKFPRRETDECMPMHPYAVGKFAGELYTRLYHQLFDIQTTTLRLFSVFGPRQNPKIRYAAVIPKFITNVLRDRPCEVFGDGSQKRSFSYVDDVVDGILAALDNAPGRGEIYNISSPDEISITELTTLIGELCDKTAKVIYSPALAGDQEKNTVDVTKAKEELGFSTKHSLRKGLEKLVKHLSSQ